MRKFLSVLAIAATSAFIAAPASASLIGSTVTGSAFFNGGTTNFFDPVNGLVPATGYTNSSSKSNSATVSITGNNIEFGLSDALNTDSADFNGGTLTITDVSRNGGYSYKYVFTDSAFAGLTLIETSDNFLNGGATASLVGTTLTINIPSFASAGTYSASYTFNQSGNGNSGSGANSVPEPASIALLGLGLLGVAASRRKSSKK